MKQIFYFTIGLLIPFILFAASNSHAGWEYSATYEGLAGMDITAGGVCSTQTYPDYAFSEGSWNIHEEAGDYGFSWHDSGWTATRYTVTWTSGSVGVGDPVLCAGAYTDAEVPEPNQDSDGDGIPDHLDMYPTDPTPYEVQMVSYQTLDGTPEGEHIRECYVTSHGDRFCVGAPHNEELEDFIVDFPQWEDPETVFPSQNPIDPNDTAGSTPEQPDYNTEETDGNADQNLDPNTQDGTQSDGTETDNEALRNIQDNTAATAKNTKRLNDYMNELNKAIKNMDRNISIQTGIMRSTPINQNSGGTGEGEVINFDGLTKDELDDSLNHAEADAAKISFEAEDVSSHYSSINGDIVEGTDYEQPGELGEETFISDFFSNNPIISAFEESGIETSNSTPIFTVATERLGTHTFDLSPLQSGFQTAGALLFALCSITSIILVVKG